jgi:ABC-2 type transport system permease protein
MKRFLTFTKALAKIHLRNRVVLFWNLVFPLFMLVIYGVVFRGDGTMIDAPGFNYIDWVLPGVLVFNALSFGLITSSSMMLSMRELGVLRRLQATPMPAWQLITSYALVNMTIVLLQSLIIIAFAVVVFDATISATGLLLTLPMIIVGIVTFMAFGQIVGGLAPTAATAVIAGQLLYFTMMFTTDLIFPIDSLPAWLQGIVIYLPSYPVVQLIRPTMLEGTLPPNMALYLGLLLAYIVGAGFIAARLFRWEPRS